jgi:cyanophycin synthetase
VLCGITGGGDRAGVRDRMAALGVSPERVVDVPPISLLIDGLGYGRSAIAVVLDAEPDDVPARYRDPELAQRLVSVLADVVVDGGIVVCPAKEWEVQDLAREAGCRVAIFSAADDVTVRDAKVASAVAQVRGGRIVLEVGDSTEDAGELADGATPAAQVAAALAARALRGIAEDVDEGGVERDGAAAEQR